MGLRCLLGHEYANREVEREREERGNEVVVTYRTVETCERCGERRTVSENKEVRPVRDPESEAVATGLGGAGGVAPDSGEGDGAPAAEDAPAPADEPVDEGSPVPGETPTPGETTAEEADAPGTPPADDGETEDVDDAVILDGDADREPGEWPDSGDPADEEVPEVDAADDGTTVVSDGDAWPDSEGYAAEPDDGEPADVEFGDGLAPGDTEEAPAAAANGTASASGKQFVAAETVEPVTEPDHDSETEFYCPNCGYARTAGGSSMRAGDICPDCHRGYIAERPR